MTYFPHFFQTIAGVLDGLIQSLRKTLFTRFCKELYYAGARPKLQPRHYQPKVQKCFKPLVRRKHCFKLFLTALPPLNCLGLKAKVEGNYEQPSQGTSDDWHFVTISAKPGSDKVFQGENIFIFVLYFHP